MFNFNPRTFSISIAANAVLWVVAIAALLFSLQRPVRSQTNPNVPIAPTVPAETWEYTSYISQASQDMTAKANQGGRLGWEMVNCHGIDSGGTTQQSVCYFKRRIRPR